MGELLPVVRQVADLRSCITGWRSDGMSVGLVPTMGAMHDGHLSLVRASIKQNDRTCVSLFVNPKQFGEGEDFGTYPRDEAADAAALAALSADLMYAPAGDAMYPAGSVTAVSVPGLGDWLEGEFRPGFFTGVATVVTKLLLQAMPDAAYFGEKDYQQLCLVCRLVADLDIPVEIAACPIVRDSSGLALSSRNAYLTAGQRRIAPALYRTLRVAAERCADSADAAGEIERATAALLEAGFDAVDYVALCDSESLAPVERVVRPARLLAAVRLSTARLIDNVAVG